MQAQDASHPTGVADDSVRGNKEVARARHRKAMSALAMKKKAESWETIAEVVGYPTPRAALIAVERALEEELKTEESKVFMRQLAGQRLERLLRGVWHKATDPDHPEHLAAVSSAKSLIAQHAKLYGLDAPTEMLFHSPSAGELERWVSTVLQETNPALTEPDIFGDVEGEVLSDEETFSSDGLN